MNSSDARCSTYLRCNLCIKLALPRFLILFAPSLAPLLLNSPISLFLFHRQRPLSGEQEDWHLLPPPPSLSLSFLFSLPARPEAGVVMEWVSRTPRSYCLGRRNNYNFPPYSIIRMYNIQVQVYRYYSNAWLVHWDFSSLFLPSFFFFSFWGVSPFGLESGNNSRKKQKRRRRGPHFAQPTSVRRWAGGRLEKSFGELLRKIFPEREDEGIEKFWVILEHLLK